MSQSAAAPPPVIAIREVSKIYRTSDVEVHALRAIDLTIARGEMVAIMGQSGSGKSTLMNIIGTLDRPTSGSYQLDGVPVENLDETELARLRNRKIGFVFQSFNLLPRHTALANVEVPLVYGRVAKAERSRLAAESLRRVGLSDRMDHHPNQLSGGQQQRVAIARAMVTSPVLLLADEPTGALDTEMTDQIMKLFCDLHQSGMTVVLVTHEPMVAAYAERIVRFRDGRIVSDEANRERAHAH
ncbi:MAG: ABC transporter ATP-binding protein [Deltaproteobacteria bacterium]|jgi:putative ABC transport system ATP-binding protein|nr:ABC transporter ATP-binding protein [Deltaproteobacteria bacterium]